MRSGSSVDARPAARPRVVVVTGASAGVGRAVVREFAARGDRLGLIARGEEGLQAARRDAERLGAAAVSVARVDVADAAAVSAAAAQFDRELGPLDVWVNNAMASVFAPVWEVKAEEFRRVTEVTYLGYVNGTLAALERMRPRDQGTIVLVGSALAYRGIPLQAAYCGAKHAIEGFRDSLRAELRGEHSGVRVTTVNLPAVNTPQFEWVRTRLPRHPQPVPPIYQPEVAARAVAWAADHAPRELDVGMPTVLTRLANKLVPGLLDHYLGRSGAEDQQTDEPVDHARRRDNLDAPADDERDAGAHGRFDDRATGRSAQLWATTHKPYLATAAGLTGLAAVVAARRS